MDYWNCASIVEEIVFRGVLLKYIEDKANIATAIIVTFILFALVHLFNGRLVGIDLFIAYYKGCCRNEVRCCCLSILFNMG
ncbi:CPBP family intramembrane metalloprotease [Staphylococcus pseudintermedius]|nr:CPBP family intramembrane metalloprotease [Staphylococcus pseudintermedius]MBC8712426.1 CPBP family intramembrane metalloprotease [Staphylococcus pseudintermedius]